MANNTLLTLPPELRNRICELIIPPPNVPDGYTPFRRAIKERPPLLNTCRQLRHELLAMYFSNVKLVVNVKTPDIQKFREFVQETPDHLISELRRFSLTLPCCGRPEFNYLRRWIQSHSVLYDIEASGSGEFVTREAHGYWIKTASQLVFGERMNRNDAFGYSTCTDWAALPMNVGHWQGNSIRRDDIVALIDRLCADERVARRLDRASVQDSLFSVAQ